MLAQTSIRYPWDVTISKSRFATESGLGRKKGCIQPATVTRNQTPKNSRTPRAEIVSRSPDESSARGRRYVTMRLVTKFWGRLSEAPCGFSVSDIAIVIDFLAISFRIHFERSGAIPTTWAGSAVVRRTPTRL